MLIPLLLGGAAAAGLAGNIGSAFADQGYQKANKRKIAELEAMKAAGGFGLNPAEQRLLDQRLQAPVQAAAGEQQRRNEAIQASLGTTSGASLAQLGQQAGRLRAEGAVNAAQQVLAADEAKVAQQEAELEQRLATKAAMKADDWNTILGGVSESLGAAGALAGAPPGTFQLSNAFGTRFSGDERKKLRQFAKENPDEWAAMFDEILGAGEE